MPPANEPPVTPRSSGDRFRRAALGALLVAGFGFFLREVHQHYPIQRWLFWHYAGYWLGTFAFIAAALSLGHFLVGMLLGRAGSGALLERLALALPLGVLALGLLLFVGGALRLYGPIFFFALPALSIALGGPGLLRWARRVRRHWTARRRQAPPTPLWTWFAIAAGCFGLLLVYIPVLTPENVQFDSRWKHMGLAEQFVTWGGIRRFPEGYVFSSRSHFSSLLYTWGFMVPNSRLFDRMLLSAHLEYGIFVWTTVVGIPAMVRRLVPRAPAATLWVVRFAFPGVFLYDSNVSGGADHIGAMWCAPLLLLGLAVLRRPTLRRGAALGFAVAGAVLVKETVAIMLAPVACGLAVAASLRELLAKLQGKVTLSRHWWAAPLATAATTLLLSSPYWLKNLVWYGDPLYPVLHKYFNSKPWLDDSLDFYVHGYLEFQMWRPERTLGGVVETLKALLSFSFVPNNWKQFHGAVPVFGSLFTLLSGSLFFLKNTRRLWLVVGWSYFAIFVWYWVHHQDRYLQAILPFLAASTAAMLILIWRSGQLILRGALSALIALQIVWGGDVFFIATHAMVRSPLKAVADLMQSGFKRNYTQRFTMQHRQQELRRALPKGARVVLHEQHDYLGIGRDVINDWPTWQFGLSYGLHKSPRETWSILRGMGATHVVWRPDFSVGFDTIAGDLAFFEFAENHTTHQKRVGGFALGTISSTPPPQKPRAGAWALVVGCPKGAPSGLYHLADLRVLPFGPKKDVFPPPRITATNPLTLASKADFAVVQLGCKRTATQNFEGFIRVAKRARQQGSRAYELWLRPRKKL